MARAIYETVIGLEVHAQILTASKMFCACSADYASAAPNTHVCPVCMALPGVLPVINRAAVEKTILAGLALHCTISPCAVFARKNYHYADLPKGYQISQYELPFCRDGWLGIESDAGARRIGITRAHLEEDTAKLLHMAEDATAARLSENRSGYALVDLNRAGVPLLEIVTQPDLRTPEEARTFLVKLRQILRYLGVSTADMERGAMRCEANVSLRPLGQQALGTKVEVKNLNSFRSVKQALEYEVLRQTTLLERGEQVAQVTVGWDEEAGRTVVQRTKETADDYRYFPEPDLPPLVIDRAGVEELQARLPELPDVKIARYLREYGLEPRDAQALAAERAVAEYFEAAVAVGVSDAQMSNGAAVEAKTVANWITGELFHLLNAAGIGISAARVPPDALAELLGLMEAGRLNRSSAKKVFGLMFESGRRAGEIVQDLGLVQVSDARSLADIVAQVVAMHPVEVARYRGGEQKLLSWLMGLAMRETRGQGNPDVLRDLLRKALG